MLETSMLSVRTFVPIEDNQTLVMTTASGLALLCLVYLCPYTMPLILCAPVCTILTSAFMFKHQSLHPQITTLASFSTHTVHNH